MGQGVHGQAHQERTVDSAGLQLGRLQGFRLLVHVDTPGGLQGRASKVKMV